MVEPQSDDAAKRPALYYEAPGTITLVDGVTRAPINTWQDEYSGTAEALAASGLLPLDRFPGMPGQNAVSAALRPLGIEWCGRGTPGHMWVCRRMNGTFRIQLTVSDEEYERRREEKGAREEAAEQAAEDVLRCLADFERTYCAAMINHGGRYEAEQRFRDPRWLASLGITPAVAKKLLYGLEVFDQAEAARKVELELSPASLTATKALLDRVSRGGEDG